MSTTKTTTSGIHNIPTSQPLELKDILQATKEIALDDSEPMDESLLLHEMFLVNIASHKYSRALDVANEILNRDPKNELILEYVPVLKERLTLDLQLESEQQEQEQGEEEDDEGDEDTDSEDDSESGSNDTGDSDSESESNDDTEESDTNADETTPASAPSSTKKSSLPVPVSNTGAAKAAKA
ncbi:hypothetical protein HDU76_007179 [Blyttiomyces sp. JEL0837]|nr:hypothetical protein HDU76_007179 [Blyttiomyces sp. JEL0837]